VRVPLNGRIAAHRLSPTGTPIEARPYTARYSSLLKGLVGSRRAL